MSEMINKLRLSHVLKADPFSQQYVLQNTIKGNIKLVECSEDFFNFIYAQPDNSIIVNGVYYRKKQIIKWFNEAVLNNGNCILLIIEGYAGCGKSTWVQSILYHIFNSNNFEYSYYNYNVGVHPGSKDKINPIKDSLMTNIISQMVIVLQSPDGEKTFKTMQALTTKEYFITLDNNTIIWDCFMRAENIVSSANRFFDLSLSSNELVKQEFIDCAKSQLESDSFDIYRLLCIDYLWRLSQYIANPDKYRNNFYVCYDNLDAIYDNDLLALFKHTLLYFRYNLNEFILKINDDPAIKSYVPHFVIFTTYRKITEIRSERYNTEMIEDIYTDLNYVMNVDISEIYNYIQIVKKRLNHFKDRINCDSVLGNETITKQIVDLYKILNLNVFKKYSNMLNNNYRSCGNVLSIMINEYNDEMMMCKKLVNQKKDGYNERRSCYIGASSVFLHVMCKILGQKGIWGSKYLDLTNHDTGNSKYPTSLSRLILNYILNDVSNSTPVSSIFKTFEKVFDYKYICKIMGQMLKRASDEIWRRPIYYSKNAFLNESDITNKFLEQYNLYKNGNSDLVEFTLCEGGKTFIEKITPHFEFYSSRLLPSCKSIYCINEIQELEEVLKAVYNQIETCCMKQNEFRILYMKKYELSSEEYLNCLFHSRTKAGNLQLHIERVIFSHIGYLNDYRMYLINVKPKQIKEKDIFNEIVIEYIGKYLNLYKTQIVNISANRQDIANQMEEKYNLASRKDNPKKNISIDIED